MRETMRAAPGVGLAAPQVGVSLQIAVIEDRVEYHAKATPEQLAERGRRHVPFHVLINPRIVARRTAASSSSKAASVSTATPRSFRARIE